MRTLCKLTMGFILIAIGIGHTIPALAQDNSDYYTVNGIVKDSKTKKKVEFATVSIPGSSIGTITNADGEFTIKFKDSIHAKNVEISHLGYKSFLIPFNNRDIDKYEVMLQPSANVLDEVVIRAREPRLIVEEAMRKIPDNYSSSSTLLTGFYRETAQKNRNYINISEAVVDIYKTAYHNDVNRDRVQIHKGRSLLSQKKSDTLVVKLLGGPNLSVYVDVVKNPDLLLNLETLPYYNFKMEEATMINDRPQYVISFAPQAILPYALYEGKLYVDKERLSFTRAEFHLDMNDTNKATQAILRKKPFGLRFKPIGVSFMVNYTEQDNVSYLSYIRNEVRFKCDWKRRLFATNYSIISEMVVTDRDIEKADAIPFKASFRSGHSLSDKVSDFLDDDFWGAYNIIEPTESLESAVDKLKKQHR